MHHMLSFDCVDKSFKFGDKICVPYNHNITFKSATQRKNYYCYFFLSGSVLDKILIETGFINVYTEHM